MMAYGGRAGMHLIHAHATWELAALIELLRACLHVLRRFLPKRWRKSNSEVRLCAAVVLLLLYDLLAISLNALRRNLWFLVQGVRLLLHVVLRCVQHAEACLALVHESDVVGGDHSLLLVPCL